MQVRRRVIGQEQTEDEEDDRWMSIKVVADRAVYIVVPSPPPQLGYHDHSSAVGRMIRTCRSNKKLFPATNCTGNRAQASMWQVSFNFPLHDRQEESANRDLSWPHTAPSNAYTTASQEITNK